MTPQELKASILQKAIQGKLVEQRKSEGTAQKLYDQIQRLRQSEPSSEYKSSSRATRSNSKPILLCEGMKL